MAAGDSKKYSGRPVTVSVRLEPDLYYLAQLGARKQRRSLASFAEWAIEKALDQVVIMEVGDSTMTIDQDKKYLWSVDPVERFVNLAFRYPDLLTHYEQVLWKLVRDNPAVWLWRRDRRTSQWTTDIKPANLSLERLRAHWSAFEQVAAGEADESVLPTWPENGPEEAPPAIDDDVPF